AARRCTRLPSFGPKSPSEVADAMLAVLRPQDVFGPSLDDALIDAATDSKGAACQATVAAGLAGPARDGIAEFNRRKARGLAAGTLGSAADLEACFGADPRGRAARKRAGLERSVRRRCAETPVAVAFPGKCAGTDAASLAGCLAQQASCGVCIGLKAADGS